jgi:hypothetical protein
VKLHVNKSAISLKHQRLFLLLDNGEQRLDRFENLSVRVFCVGQQAINFALVLVILGELSYKDMSL